MIGREVHLGNEGLGAILDLIVGVEETDVACDDLVGVGSDFGRESGLEGGDLVLQQGDGGVGVLLNRLQSAFRQEHLKLGR